jgi:hypothetical protein
MKIHAWNSQPVSLLSNLPTPSLESEPAALVAPGEGRPGRLSMLGPGRLIGKLMELEQEDPNKLREVLLGLTSRLDDTASNRATAAPPNAAGAEASAAAFEGSDVHEKTTMLPPPDDDEPPPTQRWSPPPSLIALSRFGGRADDSGLAS